MFYAILIFSSVTSLDLRQAAALANPTCLTGETWTLDSSSTHTGIRADVVQELRQPATGGSIFLERLVECVITQSLWQTLTKSFLGTA